MDEEPRRFFVHDHLCDQILVHLILADLLTELLSLIAIVHRRFACRTRQAHGAGGTVEPRLVQLPHANFEAIAFFAKQVFSGKREILKGQFADGRRMRAQRLKSAASDAWPIEVCVER